MNFAFFYYKKLYSVAGASNGGIAGSSTGAISGNSSAKTTTGIALQAKANNKPNKSFFISSPQLHSICVVRIILSIISIMLKRKFTLTSDCLQLSDL